MRTYKIILQHDKGQNEIFVKADDESTAKELICKAENCPLAAIKKIKEQFYKVVKVFRISSRRQILERGLTEAEAQRVVKRFPDSSRSMVIYCKQ